MSQGLNNVLRIIIVTGFRVITRYPFFKPTLFSIVQQK